MQNLSYYSADSRISTYEIVRKVQKVGLFLVFTKIDMARPSGLLATSSRDIRKEGKILERFKKKRVLISFLCSRVEKWKLMFYKTGS